MTEAHRHMDQGALALAFEELRPRLLGIAYRMLETRKDAEDALQEVWFRFQRAKGVKSVEAFLVATVTRVSMDELRAAQVRRTKYPGSWLPEPVLTSDGGMGLEEERHEVLGMATLLVLGRLDPLERAVFVLREAFSYPFEEVARSVRKRLDVCHQIADRAARRVQAERPRVEADAAAHTRLLKGLLRAAEQGDPSAVEGMLSEDVTIASDGGGRGVPVISPIVGPSAAARFLVELSVDEAPDTTREMVELNGLPGLVVRVAGEVVTTVSLDVREGRACRVYMVRNLQKLKGLQLVA